MMIFFLFCGIPAEGIIFTGPGRSSWGISCEDIGITKGSALADAVLVLDGIRRSPDAGNLQIYLLRNPALGYQEWPSSLMDEIHLGTIEGRDVSDPVVFFFSEINDSESPIWKVFRQPFVMAQADESRTQYSSATLEFMDILGTETTFGLGFLMESGGSVEIQRISLQVSILPHSAFGQTLFKSFTLLEEGFASSELSGWSIVDEGILYAPSAWNMTDGKLRQMNNTCQQNLQSSAVDMRGTSAIFRASREFGDFQMAVDLCSYDDDAIGILFRYRDPDNYYRFSWDQQRKVRRLVKCLNGKFTVLAQDEIPYEIGKTYRVAIVARGPQFAVAVNKVPIFSVWDSQIKQGFIGLYCCADQGAVFDNLRIEGTRIWTQRLMAPFGTIKATSAETMRIPIGPKIPLSGVRYWMEKQSEGLSIENQELVWQPDSSQAGLHLVRVFGESDGRFDSQTAEIHVTLANHPPRIEPLGIRTILEDDILDVFPDTSDPDGDTITLRLENSPAGFRLEQGRLFWRPDYSQAGSYVVRVIVSDGLLESAGILWIRVKNKNRPPVIGTLPPIISLMTGRYLNLSIPTADPDGDPVVLSCPNLPPGAFLTNSALTWMPGSIQSGLYELEIIASDDQDHISKRIEIRVF